MPRDASIPGVIRFLGAVRRRLLLLDLVAAGSIASAIFASTVWLSSPFLRSGMSISIAAALSTAAGSGLLFRSRHRRMPPALARAVESSRTDCRNLIVTAEELHRFPERASSWMRSAIMERASGVAAGIPLAQVAPAGRAAGWLLVAVVAVGAAAVAPTPGRLASSIASGRFPGSERTARDANSIVVTIHPPSYAQLPETSVRDPQRIDVLEGSLVSLSTAGETSRSLRFGTRVIGILGGGGTPIQFTARDSGYFAVEPSSGGRRELILLSVTPDRAPAVKIEQPARDLLLADANRQVQVKISASDDLGLKALELRYTKLSGAGEQFDFREGALPLRLGRGNAREWRADAAIALQSLGLTPGDAVVYRAVAMDRRPGESGLNSSDTFFIEVAGPGQVPLEGVDMPPDEARYALSQQMVVLKIERLKAGEKRMAQAAAVEQAGLIAAEQRAVRANFIFLLGGHVEDEEEEAAQSTEISEGRLVNPARRDLDTAIREMTRTEQGLVAVDTSAALVAARAAVTALQRAFEHGRYFLRTTPVRSRVDPSRRLTGNLAGAATWRREASAASKREGSDARALLGDLLVLANAIGARSAERAAIERLAERALAIDPGSATWQELARRMEDLSDALQRPAEASRSMDDIIRTVVREADRSLLPRTPLAEKPTPLRRAWEGLRR